MSARTAGRPEADRRSWPRGDFDAALRQILCRGCITNVPTTARRRADPRGSAMTRRPQLPVNQVTTMFSDVAISYSLHSLEPRLGLVHGPKSTMRKQEACALDGVAARITLTRRKDLAERFQLWSGGDCDIALCPVRGVLHRLGDTMSTA